MRKRFIPVVIVTAQVLLGNLCMMPFASAMEAMPMDHDMEEMEQIVEMVMTPVHPMSSVHCDGCVTITRPKHHSSPMTGGMPCTDGHCLSGHSPSTAVVAQSSLKDVMKIALRPAFFFLEPQTEGRTEVQARAAPHLPRLLAQMVVMRE